MSNMDNHNEEEFALYTEKIVPKPAVKYKKLISGGKFVLKAVLFGMIASVVIAVLYPVLRDTIDDKKTPKELLTIEKDEYPSEEWVEGETEQAFSENPENVGTEHMSDGMSAVSRLKAVAADISRSMVTIDVYKTDVDNILMETQSATETVGIVIGQVSGEYIILTNYASVSDSASLVVKFSSATEVNAQIRGSSEIAQIAIVSVKESDIPSNERATIATAQLDNSYYVKQGDVVIAAGRLYGQNKAVDYGVVTGITTKSGIDNAYDIINTGLAYSEGDYGYLFNTAGNVVGISVSGERKTFAALGISDLKSVIQELSNGNQIVYLGIRGQNVTGTMATLYGLPVGIYVMEVELDSPAYEAGLQPGDIITGIDGNMVLTIQAFSEKLYQCGSDQQIFITAKRLGKDDYKEMTFTAVTTVR